MRFLRFVACAGIAALAVLITYRWCYRPLRCDVMTKSIVARTSQMLDLRNSIAPLFARRHLEVLRECIPCLRPSVAAYMAAAANSSIVGDRDQAIRFYEDALRYDRRPELYYNLGLTYVDAGRVEEGVKTLITAGMFNPIFITTIPDYTIRMRVDEAVAAHRMLPWHLQKPAAVR